MDHEQITYESLKQILSTFNYSVRKVPDYGFLIRKINKVPKIVFCATSLEQLQCFVAGALYTRDLVLRYNKDGTAYFEEIEFQ